MHYPAVGVLELPRFRDDCIDICDRPEYDKCDIHKCIRGDDAGILRTGILLDGISNDRDCTRDCLPDSVFPAPRGRLAPPDPHDDCPHLDLQSHLRGQAGDPPATVRNRTFSTHHHKCSRTALHNDRLLQYQQQESITKGTTYLCDCSPC